MGVAAGGGATSVPWRGSLEDLAFLFVAIYRSLLQSSLIPFQLCVHGEEKVLKMETWGTVHPMSMSSRPPRAAQPASGGVS